MLMVLIIVAVVLLICLFSSSKTCRLPWTHFAVCNAICYLLSFAPLTAEQNKINSGGQGHPPNPIATPQASSVPAEESLYDVVVTKDQRVAKDDGGVGPAGNVPTCRSGNVQEAVYFQPDTSKKNMGVSVLNTDNLIDSKSMCVYT